MVPIKCGWSNLALFLGTADSKQSSVNRVSAVKVCAGYDNALYTRVRLITIPYFCAVRVAVHVNHSETMMRIRKREDAVVTFVTDASKQEDTGS